MREILLWLSNNWMLGYILFSIVIIAIHLIVSIRLLIIATKKGYNVGVLYTVPLLNILVYGISAIKNKKATSVSEMYIEI